MCVLTEEANRSTFCPFCLHVPMWLPLCKGSALVLVEVRCLEWRVLRFVSPNHMLCLNNLSQTSEEKEKGGGCSKET